MHFIFQYVCKKYFCVLIYVSMKEQENKNLLNRIIVSIILLTSIGLSVFSIIEVFKKSPENKTLDLVALFAVSFFCLFEIVVVMRRWKKESYMYKIAFDEKGDHFNTVALIAVIIGTIFGAGISAIGLFLFLTRDDIQTKCNVLIILSIGYYLFINCVCYYIYILMFRKKPFKIEDLIK